MISKNTNKHMFLFQTSIIRNTNENNTYIKIKSMIDTLNAIVLNLRRFFKVTLGHGLRTEAFA